MQRIKVCLLGLPPLLSDMAIEVLGADPEFELSIAPGPGAALPQPAADAIVTALTQPAVERLLSAALHMQAFAIEQTQGTVSRTRLRLVHEAMGELSLAELAGAIKRSVQQARLS